MLNNMKTASEMAITTLKHNEIIFFDDADDVVEMVVDLLEAWYTSTCVVSRIALQTQLRWKLHSPKMSDDTDRYSSLLNQIELTG